MVSDNKKVGYGLTPFASDLAGAPLPDVSGKAASHVKSSVSPGSAGDGVGSVSAADSGGPLPAGQGETAGVETRGSASAGRVYDLNPSVMAAGPRMEDHEIVAVKPGSKAVSKAEARLNEDVLGYDRQLEVLGEAIRRYTPETDEQRKKRERREKSKRIVAAVSDGLSALGNLVFTTRYAPDMYDGERGSLAGRVNDRIEKLRRQRELDADRYLQYSLRYGDVLNGRARTKRELEAQREKLKLAQAEAQMKAQKHYWDSLLQADRQREQKGKGDRAVAEAAKAEYEAANKPESLRLDNEYKKAGIKQRNASAANSYASAAEHNRGNLLEYTAWDRKGRPQQFAKKDAAITFAQQNGTYKTKGVVVKETKVERNMSGPGRDRKETRTTAITNNIGYPGKPAAETMPGVKGNNRMPGIK